MTGAIAWFGARSLRERRLILAMLALLAITVVWGGVILPVRDGLSSARARHADAVVRLGRTLASVEAIERARRSRPDVVSAPFPDAVRARAEEAGFTLASLDQDGADRVRASIATARPTALLAWLAALERGGMLVEAVSLTPNPDRTVAVQMTLRARTR